MNINPIRDRILIKPADVETQTSSGLFIPNGANEGPVKGTVVSTGTGRVTKEGNVIPMVVSEGNIVLYVKGSGQTVKVDNQEHLILTEDQILAIVE